MGSKVCPHCGKRIFFKPEEAFLGVPYETFFCRKLDKKLGLCPISGDEHCPNICDGKPLNFTNSFFENDKIYLNFLNEYKDIEKCRNRYYKKK